MAKKSQYRGGHEVGKLLSGEVASVGTDIGALKEQTFYAIIKCDQCNWVHRLKLSRKEYKDAIKAMIENVPYTSNYISEEESSFRNHRGESYEGGYDT